MFRQAILLISDIDPQIFSLRQLLTRHQYDVRVAKSAEDAMHQLHLEPRFGLVICDLAIRKTDALDLMARILRVNYSTDQGILPPPKIIALTTPAANDAKATARVYREIALYTNHNVITKPVDPLVLLEKVESLIGAPARLPSKDAPLPDWTGESLAPAPPQSLHDRVNEINEKIIRLDERHHEIAAKTRRLEERIVRIEEAVTAHREKGSELFS